jgi:hypothetical protein
MLWATEELRILGELLTTRVDAGFQTLQAAFPIDVHRSFPKKSCANRFLGSFSSRVAAPHLMKTASPLDKGGLQWGWAVWVVGRGTHPGASRPLSLR